jgi:hypothetical protein
MKWIAFPLFLILVGCSSPYTVTLWQNGGFSGIEERYAVRQDGTGTKTVRMPVDSESRTKTYEVDKRLVDEIGSLLRDSTKSLLAIKLNGKGEMTTGITIEEKNVHHEMAWANVDPPILGTLVLDSLYHLMLDARQQMMSP